MGFRVQGLEFPLILTVLSTDSSTLIKMHIQDCEQEEEHTKVECVSACEQKSRTQGLGFRVRVVKTSNQKGQNCVFFVYF